MGGHSSRDFECYLWQFTLLFGGTFVGCFFNFCKARFVSHKCGSGPHLCEGRKRLLARVHRMRPSRRQVDLDSELWRSVREITVGLPPSGGEMSQQATYQTGLLPTEEGRTPSPAEGTCVCYVHCPRWACGHVSCFVNLCLRGTNVAWAWHQQMSADF